jgi:subtilisin family serine protease
MDNRWIAPGASLVGLVTLSLLASAEGQDIGAQVKLDDGVGIATTHPIDNAQDFSHADDRIFIRFKADATLEQRAEIHALIGPALQSFDLVEDLVCVKLTTSVSNALDVVKFRTDVLQYAEPAFLYEAFDTLPNDPDYGSLYGMESINMPEAWDITTGGAGFRIAIIDSGTQLTHPDLAANIINNPLDPPNGLDDDGNGLIDDYRGWDFYDGDNNPDDQNGHGTHTAGTVGAVGNNGIGVVGVNWNCEIVALRVGNQYLDSQAIYNSVAYACEIGALVSNNSYGGGGYSQSFFDIISEAGSQYRHVFCAAAGNGGYNEASYPALYSLSNIISVAAVDSNDNLAGFSQYGIPSVDIAAPGVDTVSTIPGGYASYSGTSMATPHVAGVAALVHHMLGNATAQEVIQKIYDNVRPVSGLSNAVVTGGIIDAAATLADLFQGPVGSMISSVPVSVESGDTTLVQFEVDPREDTISSVNLFYRTDNGQFSWTTVPVENVYANTWEATLPAVDCEDSPQFYITYSGAQSGAATIPSGGSLDPFSFSVGTLVVFAGEDFNNSAGWTASTTATAGGWERAIPSTDSTSVDTCSAPGADSDGSGYCWVTGNGVSATACANDIDSGQTVLTSDVYDLGGSNAQVTFAWWYDNTSANNTEYDDNFIIEVSGNSGSSWTQYASVSNGNSAQTGWSVESFVVGDYVQVTSGFVMRFTASDDDPGSVVEAAIDAFTIESFSCEDGPKCVGPDINGDGFVGATDLAALLATWNCTGSDCPGDVDCNGVVNAEDLSRLLANWD